MAGQIHGLYPEGDHPFFRRHLPHLPRLPQAAGSGLCAADAHLRLRQCGREPPPHPAVQLGLRPHQLQRPRGQLLHRPRERRSPGAGVQGDDSRPPHGGHRRHHGRGVQSYVPQREPAEPHGALLFFPAEPGRQLLQRQRLRQRVCQRAAHGPEIPHRLSALLGAGISHRRLPLRPHGSL